MPLEKITAESQGSRHSFTRIFVAPSSQRPRADGRLFVLPYDLLEEIAMYFPCRKAASLLTVNSQFHGAFARAVWRSLYLNDKLAKRIPASAWKTYGHLVRFATVILREKHYRLGVIQMPNVIDLTLYLTYRSYNIFEGVELNNLRRLHLNLPWYGWTKFAAAKGVELAQRVGRLGHPVAVNWDIFAEKREHTAVIDEIIAPIVDTSQHSFMITSRAMPSVPLQYFPKLVEMLTELNLYISMFGLNCLPSNPGISFPRLVKLDLRCMGHNEDDLVGANALIPDRFPALHTLHIRCLLSPNKQWVVEAFGYNWPLISELVFDDSDSPLAFATIARRVPNLKRLVVKGDGNVLNVNQLAEYLPHLQHLEIDDRVRLECDVDHQPQLQFAQLKSFIFLPFLRERQNFIPLSILNFILHGAPNLESIELYESCFQESVLSIGRGHANPSVRTLDIQLGLNRFNADTAKMLIGMFPNLKILKGGSEDDIASQQLKDEYTNIVVHFYS
ncbi:hypothetical protein GQ42DRAFT_159796 [Ramicandelaber brevisporus]|nr:hypothetical protein GQ42DRAFT_159796 [Ramicandelaber brevisporus]